MADFIDTPTEASLREEMIKCHAPVSGYFVVCALFTEKGLYIEHNHEYENPTVFEHAEIRALAKAIEAEKDPAVTKLVMLGGGKVQKFKYYIPCFGCTHSLEPYMKPDAEIHLLPLQGTAQAISVTFHELLASYSDRPYSKITSSNASSLRAELASKTILNGRELDLITDLSMLGRNDNVEFYLTGSATGRGAVSSLIISKTGGSYNDVDLIAVVKDDYHEIEIKFEDLLIRHYGEFIKEDRPVPQHQNQKGVVLKKTFYHCGPGGKERLIDLTFSKDFKGSFHYHAYELKNWFHQLS